MSEFGFEIPFIWRYSCLQNSMNLSNSSKMRHLLVPVQIMKARFKKSNKDGSAF